MRKANEPTETRRNIIRATFEVPTPLYRTFQELCAKQDVTASQAVRKFMRESVEEREAA